MQSNIKSTIYKVLEFTGMNNPLGRICNYFIIILIIINVIAVLLETIEPISRNYGVYFNALEFVSVIIFSIEYLLRVWTCVSDKQYAKPLRGRIRYIFTPLAIIDLLAVIPFYLPIAFIFDLRVLRILRLIRIFRLLKLARYSKSLKVFGSVFRSKKEDILITLFTICLLLILSSSLMYYIENDSQPEAFSSIPATMWWGIVTLTTVGYGDIFPVTVAGKFLGALIAILGIGLFALPAGIIGSGFVEEISNKTEEDKKCPHCGKPI